MGRSVSLAGFGPPGCSLRREGGYIVCGEALQHLFSDWIRHKKVKEGHDQRSGKFREDEEILREYFSLFINSYTRLSILRGLLS
jgi:hypothetical protein